jgi:LacI family transcriptional regulator
MVTIKDIARMAGVSRGTVDRVLNSRGHVDPEKAARIQEIADRLGFKPNLAGRGLAAHKKKLTLAFLHPDLVQFPFFQAVVEGAQAEAERLKEYGVKVDFLAWASESMDPAWTPRFLQEHAYDGIAAPGPGADTLAATLADGKTAPPTVAYNMVATDPRVIASVSCDYALSGRLAAGLAGLMTSGEGRVGVISADPGTAESSQQRVVAFEEELKAAYPGVLVEWHLYSDKLPVPMAEFRSQASRLVADHPEVNLVYLVIPGDYTVCDAVLAAGGDRVKIITNDLVPGHEVDLIRSGGIAATILQEPERQGRLALRLLFEYLAYGVTPPQPWVEARLHIFLRQNL